MTMGLTMNTVIARCVSLESFLKGRTRRFNEGATCLTLIAPA